MNDSDSASFDKELEEALLQDLENRKNSKEAPLPKELYLFPLLRRPMFPGVAAPMIIEPGPFLEILKQIVRSSHKCVGLVLARSETININKAKFSELYNVGVVARLLRITPLENGSAQVIFNMEKRFQIVEKKQERPSLKAKVAYFDESPVLTLELKAY
ncbi:MAG TPA: LON peptidase substrate-binding domain-containing protein, partial [Parachlamydiaceae bacterium]|nr:LON peptidase substrate-binding domain-containing protein [Parachlamydiaceae bacterium]